MRNKWFLYTIILLGGVFVSCSSEEVSEETEESTESSDQISLTDDMMTNGSIELGYLTQQNFAHTITVNGRVAVVPNNMANVSSYFSGNVVEISVMPGGKVNKGQKLLVIENPSFIQTQEDFLLTKIDLENLKIEYERQKSLAEESITAQKTFQEAEKNYLQAQTKMAALSSELKMMGISADKLTADKLSSRIVISAPIAGVVSSVDVHIGAYVSPDVSAVSITGDEGKFITFEVYEKDMTSLTAVESIQIKLPNNDQYYQAKVISVVPVVDGVTKSMKVMAEPVDDLKLVVGTYVQGKIGTSAAEGWALPEEAVLKDGEGTYIWIKDGATTEGDHTFRKMYIDLGMTANGYVELPNVEELYPETVVVVKGGFNL